MGIDTGVRLNEPTHAGGDRPDLERETGIEPASLAWKAKVLPLNYSRPTTVVEEAGFEPA